MHILNDTARLIPGCPHSPQNFRYSDQTLVLIRWVQSTHTHSHLFPILHHMYRHTQKCIKMYLFYIYWFRESPLENTMLDEIVR